MYTYLIGWSKHDKWYYGVRIANSVSPEEDLWKVYFTSSKHVQEFRMTHGEPDVVQVRRRFTDAKKAELWEYKVLHRLDVIHNERWLNNSFHLSVFR